MTRGAKPKPTAMKKAAGTLRKHRVNAGEPVFSSDGISPPVMVAKVPAALAEWNRLAPDLVRTRIVTVADVAILTAYCSAYARWMEADAKVVEYGLLVEAPRTKVPMHNMYRDIARQERADCIKFAAELGITPSARTRVKGDTPSQPTAPAVAKPGFGQLRAIK